MNSAMTKPPESLDRLRTFLDKRAAPLDKPKGVNLSSK
jgi:hypothetical protein